MLQYVVQLVLQFLLYFSWFILYNHVFIARYGEFGLWDNLYINLWMLSPTIATLIFLLLGVPCVFPEDESLLKHIINALKSELPLFYIIICFFQPFFTPIGMCTSYLDVFWVQWSSPCSFCWNSESRNWRYNGECVCCCVPLPWHIGTHNGVPIYPSISVVIGLFVSGCTI